ncbi:hypothetical protein [Streptomyces sp. NPDC051567]|uniref:hypothetical protein n=1 Tax=Streptomyces sp. NPDC051567 TaxID=3365660 RepID=UPI00378FCB1B
MRSPRAALVAATALLGAVVLGGCAGSGPGVAPGADDGRTVTRAGTAPGPAATPGPGTTTGTTTGTTPEPDPAATAETLVRVVRGGGFAGRTQTLRVTGDGSWTLSDGQDRPERSGRLEPERLTALRTALREADFAHLPGTPPPGGPTIYDGFTYTFVYDGFEVSTGTGAVPPALERVLAALPAF